MKKKYTIHINPRRLSKEEIARHKDFDSLLRKYQHSHTPERTFIKRMVYFAGSIAAAAAILFFVYQAFDRADYEQQQRDYFASQPFINTPFKNISPRFASYQVNANEGGVFEYASGSRLVVPAEAFSDEAGQTLSGEVTLHYREMHDFVDFFMSGIPMTYDSAGVQYTLESAGMIEIFAEQNGRRVNMSPGKSINVELVSNVNVSPELTVPPDYNIYQLDEKSRQWVYQEIDRINWLEGASETSSTGQDSPVDQVKRDFQRKVQALQGTHSQEIADLETTVPVPKEPLKPTKATRNDHVFDLDFNDLKKPAPSGAEEETHEELSALYKAYEKMLWQISPRETVTPRQLQQGFSEVTGISLRKINAQDYELTLEKDGESLQVIVNPVLSGDDYEKALSSFEKDFDVWQQKMAERKARIEEARVEIDQKYQEEARLAQLEFNKRIEDLKAQGLAYAATREIIRKKVVNKFRATGFGIWNCDRPLPPDLIRLAAHFVDEHGKPFKHQTAYLVDKSRNTVYQFLAEAGTPLRFNANSDNLLWLITPDQKIAVFRPEEFKSIQKDVSEHTFVLNTVDKVIENEEDVREVLVL